MILPIFQNVRVALSFCKLLLLWQNRKRKLIGPLWKDTNHHTINLIMIHRGFAFALWHHYDGMMFTSHSSVVSSISPSWHSVEKWEIYSHLKNISWKQLLLQCEYLSTLLNSYELISRNFDKNGVNFCNFHTVHGDSWYVCESVLFQLMNCSSPPTEREVAIPKDRNDDDPTDIDGRWAFICPQKYLR